MTSATCRTCGEEVRLATVAAHDDLTPGASVDPAAPHAFNGGTAWLHRPGSPGDVDRHRVSFSLGPVPILPSTGASDADVQPEEDKAPQILLSWTGRPDLILSRLVACEPYPTSASRLLGQLVGSSIPTRATLASALVVSASPATRGQRVRLLSIGVRAQIGERNVAALWELNEGATKPAWKLADARTWIQGSTAPERVAAATLLDFLTKTS